jgi:uncharacterized repeat protein (TIGR02543 family)
MLSASGLAPYNFNTPITDDLWLGAEWLLSVRFDATGGVNAPSPILFPEGGSVTVSQPQTDPIREGHDFFWWYMDAYCTVAAVFPFTATENTTLYAKWTPLEYTVKFDTNGAVTPTPSDQTVPYGSMATEPSVVPVKAGAEFDDWYTTGNGTQGETRWDFARMPVTRSMTLAAKWK